MSVKEYVHSKRNSWSPTTIKSSLPRLMKWEGLYEEGPEAFWQGIQGLKPYTRVTLWTLFTSYDKWKGKLDYESFRKENALLFKASYNRKAVPCSYEEASRRIQTIGCPVSQSHALSILSSGQRFFESIQPTRPDGNILGKGSKLRPDFRESPTEQPVGYWAFYRALKAIGLSPHDLRKLALSRAADNGASAADLCAIGGWSSISTAFYYLAPKETSRLKGLLK